MPKIKVDSTATKRDVIVREAAKLFKEKGYKAASMRELAGTVGVEAASLYNHIKSKDELLRMICFEVSSQYYDNFDQVERGTGGVLEKIERVLRFHVTQMMNNYEYVYVTDQDWRKLQEPQLTEYRELRRNYRKRFTALVQQAIDAGEVKPIDANSVVMIFMNAMGAIDQWHRIIHKVDSKTFEEIITGLLIDGVRI